MIYRIAAGCQFSIEEFLIIPNQFDRKYNLGSPQLLLSRVNHSFSLYLNIYLHLKQMAENSTSIEQVSLLSSRGKDITWFLSIPYV